MDRRRLARLAFLTVAAAVVAVPATANAWSFNFGPTNAAVDAGAYHSCRVDSCGAIECWGRDDYGQAAGDLGSYVDVTVGDYHTCGLQSDGDVACWGRSYEGQTNAPAGVFVDVEAGFQHTCGLKSNGELACWGANGNGQSSPPPGAFLDVSVGRLHSCAVTDDGEEILCWGSDGYGQTHGGSVLAADALYWYAAGEVFEEVTAGGYHTCARSNYDTVYCWGYDGYGAVRGRHPMYPNQTLAVETAAPGVYRFADNSRLSVSAGAWGTCTTFYDQGLMAPKLQCWGWPFSNAGVYTPPATVVGSFVPEIVRVGGSHACFMTEQDDLDCWGGNAYGSSTVPALPNMCVYEIDPLPWPQPWG